MDIAEMKNALWNADDPEVLREKWQVANGRAMECENLMHRFSAIKRRHGSESPQDLIAQLEIAKSVAHAAELASNGLFPTGLLRENFNWFIGQQAQEETERLAAAAAISQVPKCPDYLFNKRSPDAKALISLIQSKRWGILLPVLSEYAACIAELSRRFADALADTLRQSHDSELTDADLETLDSDGWKKLAKDTATICGIVLDLSPRERLVFTRLFHARTRWVTAGDIALVHSTWKDTNTSAQAISSVVTKLETKLGEQLGFDFEKGKENKFKRPIQRRATTLGAAEYRLHPELQEPKTTESDLGEKNNKISNDNTTAI